MFQMAGALSSPLLYVLLDVGLEMSVTRLIYSEDIVLSHPEFRVNVVTQQLPFRMFVVAHGITEPSTH